MRASFIMWNISARPCPGSPTRYPIAPARLAEIEKRIGYASIAELVVEAGERHVVTLGGGSALIVEEQARHDEQRDAFHARRGLAIGARDLGENEMHDVLAELVLGAGDPHLVTAQAVARPERVGRKFGTIRRRERRDVAEARSGLRLAQRHRAEVPPLDFRLGEHLALSRRSVRHDEVGVGVGQHAERVDAHTARAQQRVRRHVDDVGKLHAADIVVVPGREQARLRVRLQRLGGGDRQVDARAVERGLLDVGAAVCRSEALDGDALAQLEHGVEGFARVLGESRPGKQRRNVQPVVQEEFEGVAKGGHTVILIRAFGRDVHCPTI
jgi:hypothetical protein